VTELLDRIEKFRFLGREYLLWIWTESELFETDLRPTGADPCAMWFETRMTLAFDDDETLVKCAAPAQAAESKEALRRGKLPKEARIRLHRGGMEHAFTLKADTLALTGVSLPTELMKKEDDVHEVLYERMRLLEALEAILEALFRDFLHLRLSEAWEKEIVPLFGRWAHGESVDEKRYLAVKQRVLKKKPKAAAE